MFSIQQNSHAMITTDHIEFPFIGTSGVNKMPDDPITCHLSPLKTFVTDATSILL